MIGLNAALSSKQNNEDAGGDACKGSIAFYAVSRGLSLTTDAARFTGIEIDMRNLDRIRVNPNKKTAKIQGGVYGYEKINNIGDQGLVTDDIDIPYRDINTPIGGTFNSSLCEPNKSPLVGNANLQVYNVTAQRAIYALYNQNIRQHPELGGTRVLVEGYAVRGVKSFKSEDSAFSLRDGNILTYFDVRFDTAPDPLIPFAQKWRSQTVDLWNAGQPTRPPTTYVKYAAGYESLKGKYRFVAWRLERLRRLKKKYDPRNRFSWYNPIVPV
ncbi:MAG: hypothetical protein L6R38_002592 [Xanthoria sp. 2 TBL-2021]|nr:MAG: hypothetical protein L6R38_002592 [Xanthoria sp. 2 TBL-2021]